jgi:hypothetical protein
MAELGPSSIEGLPREDVCAREDDRLKDERADAAGTQFIRVT